MADPVRLYLDEDTINRARIKALRSRNVDLLTAKEADLIQVPDERHLEYATSLGATANRCFTSSFAKITPYPVCRRHGRLA